MTAPHSPCLVGCATGFSGDRTDGAPPVVRSLAARGGGTLIFETLAERTLALAQLARNQDPDAGYEPLLDDLVGPVLGDCLRHGINIVSNFGAANPPAAARRIAAIAAGQGLSAPRIAVIHGDALDSPEQRALLRERLGPEFDQLDIVSVNAYLGAEEIAQALRAGAQVVVAGRVADPSLTLGPVLAHYGWRADDWPRLGRATMAGHLLECGTQVSGGYFAVPGLKDVPGLHETGFPIAEIDADGACVIGKADNTGGRVDARTVKEQLLYEVHDPARYLTPDVVADLSQASVTELGDDRVAVHGITGHARPHELKVNVCHRGGWLAEAEISYAGVQAEARARLAGDIVARRIGSAMALRLDLIGAMSILADDGGAMLGGVPDRHGQDVRLRVAARHDDRATAERVLREVTALYCCGPAGGGGVRTSLRPRLATLSCTVPREIAAAGWTMQEARR
ncbi:MAG: acyclic terpene utilization AtuA family protein [Bordetella sp.]|uniref:acyclic terpene utilization AtuA family protein n=1 Tax=Bordetella sp. TaxID=28081 RepID=UPI003F7C965F